MNVKIALVGQDEAPTLVIEPVNDLEIAALKLFEDANREIDGGRIANVEIKT